LFKVGASSKIIQSSNEEKCKEVSVK